MLVFVCGRHFKKKKCLVYVRPSIYMYLSPLLGSDSVKLHHYYWYLIGKLVLLKQVFVLYQ